MSEGNHLKVRNIVPYYNLIRTVAFPGMLEVVGYLLLVSLLGVALSLMIYEQSLDVLDEGLLMGAAIFFFPTILSDLFAHRMIVSGDPLFYLRRCFALSLLACGVWVLIILIAAPIALINRSLAFPGYVLIAAAFPALLVRMITSLSLCQRSITRRLTFALMQPTACTLSAMALLGLDATKTLGTLALASIGVFVIASALILYIERSGIYRLGLSPLRMFRAFLMDWLKGDNQAVERYLEGLGFKYDINITAMGFRSKDSNRLKCVVINSNFHPGPFLNVGSSPLPYLIQRLVEWRNKATALVTHGISGHELNLVSQRENEKLLRAIARLTDFKEKEASDKATKLIRVKRDGATACCQAFGRCALVTLTMAPSDMEDIPLEVGDLIARSSEHLFDGAVLVDAHNCLGEATLMPDDKLRALSRAALDAMERCAIEPQYPFRAGVGKASSSEISLSQGLGPGGVVALIVEVEGQSIGYIAIDGNNMARGLREKILSRLEEIGITCGEVMTTDTHMVNGIARTKLGYHPVGEAIPSEAILKLASEAVIQARKNLEACEVTFSQESIKLNVFGLSAFARLTDFVYDVSRLSVLTIFPAMMLGVIILLLIPI